MKCRSTALPANKKSINMDIVQQDLNQQLTVQSYQPEYLEIAGQRYDYPIILGNEVFRLPEQQVADLTLASFQAALNHNATLIIIGTGTKQQFLPAQVQAQLAQQGVGVECMTTAAACRTLAIVQHEQRAVWAWLWL